MIPEIISAQIQRAIEKKFAGVAMPDFVVEPSAHAAHGEYACNAALLLAKHVQSSPLDIATVLAAEISHEYIDHIEVAPPGFINIFLTKGFFVSVVRDVLEQKEAYGKNDLLANKNVMVEYTDPNPFKEFHIGHLMSNAIGEAVSRVVEWSGANLKRANYQGDVGMHVARAIWGFRNGEKQAEGMIKDAPAAFIWGAAYARGTEAYKKDDAVREEIVEMNKRLYDRTDASINEDYDAGRNISLDFFEMLYKRLGTKFDFYFFESETGTFGKEVVEAHSDIFEKSEGAVIFRGEKHGLHTRVFINSDGLPTYEAKELGLAKIKYEQFSYDVSLVVTGNEITEYFKVLLTAMGLVYPNLAEKTTHIPHGMLRLPSGKMSSRTGEVVSAESLLNELQAAALEKMKESSISKDSQEHIADMVGVAAIKYAILKQSSGKDIIFDMERSLSFEGDSGPYLQYTAVRAQSILNKAGARNESLGEPEQITDVERLLERFPHVVARSARDYEPHYITTYLTDLASSFNAYYAEHKILDGSKESAYRIALTEAVATVLKNGLYILGISVPSQM